MNQLPRLLGNRFGYFRVCMPEHTHGDAAAKIEITPPVDIPNVTSLATLKHKIEPRVRWNNVFVEQLANLTLS